MGNVHNAMPKSQRVRAKTNLQAIWMAAIHYVSVLHSIVSLSYTYPDIQRVLPSKTANRCKTIDRVSKSSPLEIADHRAAHATELQYARRCT